MASFTYHSIPTPFATRKTQAVASFLAALLLSALPAAMAMADTFTDQPRGADGTAGRCVVGHSLEKNGPFRVAPNL